MTRLLATFTCAGVLGVAVAAAQSRVPRARTWEVVDERGRVLALWETKRAAERDAERYRRAEAALGVQEETK